MSEVQTYLIAYEIKGGKNKLVEYLENLDSATPMTETCWHFQDYQRIYEEESLRNTLLSKVDQNKARFVVVNISGRPLAWHHLKVPLPAKPAGPWRG